MTEDNREFRILYFSGTGNTEWVVKKIQEGLISRGHICEIQAADRLHAECGLHIGKQSNEEQLKTRLQEFLPENCVLVLAYPVYESAIPLPLRTLLPLLPDGNGRRMAVVSTMLMAGGDACHLPEQILEKRGYKPIFATYIKMPNNIKIPKFDFFEIKNGEELDSYYESAGKAVDEIVDCLIKERGQFEGKGIGDYILGVSQRFGEKMLVNFLCDHLFVHAKCIKCGFCVSICPTGNINMDKGYPEFGRNCCQCLRCYNFCSVNAIQITDATLNEEKYIRYKGFDNWKPHKLRKVDPIKARV